MCFFDGMIGVNYGVIIEGLWIYWDVGNGVFLESIVRTLGCDNVFGDILGTFGCVMILGLKMLHTSCNDFIC